MPAKTAATATTATAATATTATATAAPVASPAEAAERAREISAARRLVQASVDVVAQAMVTAWQSRTRPLRSGPLHRV